MSWRHRPAPPPEWVQGTTLIVGTYPPMPGHAATVTLAATRRAYAAGEQVVVAAPRHGAAHRTIRIVGPAAGPRLDSVRTEHGTRRLVLCVEAGMPVPIVGGRGPRATKHQLDTVAGLAAALDRFEHRTVVVAGDLGVDAAVLAPLWTHVDEVLFDGEHDVDPAALATRLGLEGSRLVDVRTPFAGTPGEIDSDAGAGEGDGGHPEVLILRRALAARLSSHAEAGRPAGVTLFGPQEVLLRERPRQAISVTARTVLGPAAPTVRRLVASTVRRARRG